MYTAPTGTSPDSSSFDRNDIRRDGHHRDDSTPSVNHMPSSSGSFGEALANLFKDPSDWLYQHYAIGTPKEEARHSEPLNISPHDGNPLFTPSGEVPGFTPNPFECCDAIIGRIWEIRTVSTDGAKRGRFSELISIIFRSSDGSNFAERVKTLAMELKRMPKDNNGHFHESVCRRGEDGGIQPVMYPGNRTGYFHELLQSVQTYDAGKHVSEKSYCAMMSGLGNEIRNMPKQEQLECLVSLLNAAKNHVFKSERNHAELLIMLTGEIGKLANWDAGGKSAPTESPSVLEEAESLEEPSPTELSNVLEEAKSPEEPAPTELLGMLEEAELLEESPPTASLSKLEEAESSEKPVSTVSLSALEEAESLESKIDKDTIASITNVLPRFPYVCELWRARCALKDPDCKREVAKALERECKRGEMFSQIDPSLLDKVFKAMNLSMLDTVFKGMNV